MAIRQRLTPTLFDKLVCDLDLWGPRGSGVELPDREIAVAPDSPQGSESEPEDKAPKGGRDHLRDHAVVAPEKFNERALKATIRRELGWLLNTVQFEALNNLEPYPEVQTSVLNYGLPDLVGLTMLKRSLHERARAIRKAIRTFEPRLDAASLKVDLTDVEPHGLSAAFLIQGDITAAAQAMPVKFRTELNPETAAVEVQE